MVFSEEAILNFFWEREQFWKCIFEEEILKMHFWGRSFENVFSREQYWGSNFKNVFFEGKISKMYSSREQLWKCIFEGAKLGE